MREVISCRMSDRVLLCMWRFSIKLLSKKKLSAGGRGDETVISYLPGREKEKLFTLNFKAFVFLFELIISFKL